MTVKRLVEKISKEGGQIDLELKDDGHCHLVIKNENEVVWW